MLEKSRATRRFLELHGAREKSRWVGSGRWTCLAHTRTAQAPVDPWTLSAFMGARDSVGSGYQRAAPAPSGQIYL
jgi:hypothetical protein